MNQLKYYQKSIAGTGAYGEVADPKKASHFTVNGGSFRPISELPNVIVNEPMNFMAQGNVDTNTSEEALELPVLNFEGEQQQKTELQTMQEAECPIMPSTFVPKQEKEKPAVRQGQNVTTLNDNEEEALPLPSTK